MVDTEEALVEYAKAMSQGSTETPTTSVKECDLTYVCRNIPLAGFKGIIIIYTMIFLVRSPTSLKEAIIQLQTQIGSEEVEFQVRRGHVLREVGKRAYHPFKRVRVCDKTYIIQIMLNCFLFYQTWFVGECGSDTGGVTRELWRLLAHELMRLCDGHDTNLVFRHDATKLQVRQV